MRFVYIGGPASDGETPPAETSVFGLTFALNEPLEITRDMFPAQSEFDYVIRKLSGNPCFAAVLSAEEADVQMVQNVFDAPAPKRRGRPPKVPTIIAEDY
jgi:hypothetical protein